MSTLADIDFNQLSTVQSDKQPTPKTIASATTVAPTTFLTFITGTTAITTITPPVPGQHMLAFIFTTTTPGAVQTTGNVLVGSTTIAQNSPVLFFYDPIQAKYYIK